MYNPLNPQHRSILASDLLSALTAAGFSQEPQKSRGSELVFSRPLRKQGVRLVVYTSIEASSEGLEVREVGADAIRVVALYTTRDGSVRPVAKASSRVNRTGALGDIVTRTITRAREVWRAASAAEGCCKKCNAPLFVSKKGNEVCAELCYTK